MGSEELTDWQSVAVLAEARHSQTPVVVTVRASNEWTHLEACLLEQADHTVHMRLADAPGNGLLKPGLKVGVSFRLGDNRYLFPSHVVSVHSSSRPRKTHLVDLQYPTGVRRIRRRQYYRVSIPRNRKVRVMFWPGGLAMSPSDDSPAVPTWFGQAVDLSVGGFRMKAPRNSCAMLAENDLLGIIMSFDDFGIVRGDAHIVSISVQDSRTACLGVRLAVLEQEQAGKIPLSTIIEKLREFGAA